MFAWPPHIQRRTAARCALPLIVSLVAASAPPAVSAPFPGVRLQPAYGWPVKPFHVQHPVRGFFGDPRIDDSTGGSSFHFGVDVSAPDGTPVYATITGTVRLMPRHRETVEIVAPGWRTIFQYWHVVPSVSQGQRVVAYRTVIGHIKAPWEHVHFAELRRGVYVNPLRPGAMGPYADATRPVVASAHAHPACVDGAVASGVVDLVAEAYDLPPVAAPAPWTGKPVTPALLRWRLLAADGRAVTRTRNAVDFRGALPPASDYVRVYTEATKQNKPWRPGHYEFFLARSFDTRTLRDGVYSVEVTAEDTAGNRTTSAFPLVVDNR